MENQTAVIFHVQGTTGIVEFDQPDSKVNVLNSLAMQRLDSILDEVSHNKSLKAVILRSRKKDVFIAGADIKEIEGITQEKEGEEKSRHGQEILNKLEDLHIPTVAVIDGVALGGGCELALACRYRVATFNEKISIGLPEVKLGIIPGFAGTYRLPRLVGLSQALTMILTGKLLSGKDALRIGLIDRLFSQNGLDERVNEFVDEISPLKIDKKRTPKKKAKFLERFLDNHPIGQAVTFGAAKNTVLKSTKGFYPAPLKALWVISKTILLHRNEALKIESKIFAELAITDISKNLVKLFYLSEKYKKLSLPGTESLKPKLINRSAVLGAGVMGGGIAQLLSDKGIWVRLKDVNFDAVMKGFKEAYKLYRQQVKRKKLKAFEVNNKMAHITGTILYSGFKNLDMVIEAVVENMEVKKQVFKELSSFVSEQTILCTNTSALSVTEMARQTKDPSKVIGLHFFNPVHRMPLIEVIKTDLTSPETIVSTLNFVKRIGKTPILVKDSCGFIVNRILLSYLNEAGRILEETGALESIDGAVEAFGMPMGPFELADEVGLDVGIKVLHILEGGFGGRFKPVNIFEQVYSKKLLGKKIGKGFYIHGKKLAMNPEVLPLIQSNHPNREFNAQEDLKRMIYIMINEAAQCLEEGVVDEPGAIDIGMIMGTGFPPFRGGLLRYADSLGMDTLINELNQLSVKLNTQRFKPCNYLNQLFARKEKFYKD